MPDPMKSDDLPRELAVPAAQALRDWHARNATVCEHTQFVNYGEAADQMLAAVLPVLKRQVRTEIAAEARAFADQFAAARSVAMAADAAILRWFAGHVTRGEAP